MNKYKVAVDVFNCLNKTKVNYCLLRGYEDIFIKGNFNDIDLFIHKPIEYSSQFLPALKNIFNVREIGTSNLYQKKLLIQIDNIELEIDIFHALCWRGIEYYYPKHIKVLDGINTLRVEEQNIIIILKEMTHNLTQKSWGGFDLYIKKELIESGSTYLNLLTDQFPENISREIISSNTNDGNSLFFISKKLRRHLICRVITLSFIANGYSYKYFFSYYLSKIRVFK